MSFSLKEVPVVCDLCKFSGIQVLKNLENQMIMETNSTKNNITFYENLHVLNYGEDDGDDILINGSGQCQNPIQSCVCVHFMRQKRTW